MTRKELLAFEYGEESGCHDDRFAYIDGYERARAECYCLFYKFYRGAITLKQLDTDLDALGEENICIKV